MLQEKLLMFIQHSSQRRQGATLVEFAIVIGSCLMFMFAIFEYGRFVMIRQLMENAAREGARQAVSGTNKLATSDFQATVTQFLVSQPLSSLDIQVYLSDSAGNNIGSWTNASFSQSIAVKVTGSYTPMLPGMGFLQNPDNLTVVATMASEGN